MPIMSNAEREEERTVKIRIGRDVYDFMLGFLEKYGKELYLTGEFRRGRKYPISVREFIEKSIIGHINYWKERLEAETQLA